MATETATHDCTYRQGWLLRGRKLNEANDRIQRLTEALQTIRDTDPVDAVLDPDRALRIAAEALR